MRPTFKFILWTFFLVGFSLLFTLPHHANAAIGIDDITNGAPVVSNNSNGGTPQTTMSWSHTIGYGANRILLVMVAGLDSGYPTSVTYGATPLTLIGNCGGATCETWELINPAVGTQTITVNFPDLSTAGYYTMTASAMDFMGVTSVDAVSTSSNNISTSVTTTAANDWLIGVAVHHDGTLTPATGQVELQNYHVGAPEIAIGYAGPVSMGSNTMTWTDSGGEENYGITLVALKPGNSIRAGGTYSGPSPLPPHPVVLSEEFMNQFMSNAGGDTVNYTAWSQSSTCAGYFNGGCVFGQWNDGYYTGMAGTRAIGIMQLNNYDPNNASNTSISLINDMASFGTLAQDMPGCDSLRSYKSRDPWFQNGKLYLSFFCMDNSSFAGYGAGIIVSPDNGVHWCNYAHYVANGDACTSAVWNANGDAPTASSTGFQWPGSDPGTDNTVKTDRLGIFQTCQEQTVNCPNIPGLNTNYDYFQGTAGISGGFYIFRVLKSADPMIPGNWQAYNNGVWDSNLQNATDQDNGNGWFGATFIWSPVYKSFLATINTGSDIVFATAPLPWGPWTKQVDIKNPSNNIGFPTLMLATMKQSTSTGDMYIGVAADNSSNGQDVQFEYVELGPGGIKSTTRS